MLVLKVRDYSVFPSLSESWNYYPAGEIEVKVCSRKDALLKSLGDEETDPAIEPPHGTRCCLNTEADNPPSEVVEIDYYPPGEIGAGTIYAEHGSAFIMSDEGKTIERI
ncbi:hypothetical protein LCGC14_1590520 [marine sediment metagenome]|uniref:Uncharacterized protein n=1 Tax=marine sediment metagenome TaxID=412755 RepID=A0A0F9LEL0_9ZZZZ